MRIQENVLYIEPNEDYNNPDGVEVRVTATDRQGATETDVFTVVVNPVNDHPVIKG